jgi:uncharacterized protein (TIGR02246 family)
MGTCRYLVAGLVALMVVGSGTQARAQEKARPAKKPSLEQRQQLTEDKEAIRDLLVAYGRDFDKRDFTAYADLFAQGGVWVGGSEGAQAYTGPEAIRAFVNKTYPPSVNPGSFHIMSSVTIQIDGENTATAWSRWTYVVIGVHGEPAPFRAGHYEDSLVRVHGVWKFKRRQVFAEAKQP